MNLLLNVQEVTLNQACGIIRCHSLFTVEMCDEAEFAQFPLLLLPFILRSMETERPQSKQASAVVKTQG